MQDKIDSNGKPYRAEDVCEGDDKKGFYTVIVINRPGRRRLSFTSEIRALESAGSLEMKGCICVIDRLGVRNPT